MLEGEDLLLCPTCGTQYDVPASQPLDACRICDDPRQFVPATGQTWTSLSQERGKHENKWTQDPVEKRMWSITAEPKLGIGQRAILLQTPHGNILWDCIAYLSDPLISFINSIGGLSAIIISHPHFYTTHLTWASEFNCPVYMHSADSIWLNRADVHGRRKLFEEERKEVLPGVTAIRVGGHFQGSLVVHWDQAGAGAVTEDGEEDGEEKKGWLGIADSFVTVPSGFSPHPRPQGQTSYSFMWSIPNMIPLPPDKIHAIWKAIKPFEFSSTHGLFLGWEIRGQDVKSRVLDSMKIQVRNQGFETHEIFGEEV